MPAMLTTGSANIWMNAPIDKARNLGFGIGRSLGRREHPNRQHNNEIGASSVGSIQQGYLNRKLSGA